MAVYVFEGSAKSQISKFWTEEFKSFCDVSIPLKDLKNMGLIDGFGLTIKVSVNLKFQKKK